MDLESVAGELYALPRDEFTAARNAAAKRARGQGRRELAEQIGALRRPSAAAWLANLLAREHPDEIRGLAWLGDGLREAQRRRHGEELRRLSAQRHQVVHALVQQAQSLASAAGYPASAAVTRELEYTFTAAVNSAAAAQALAAGRLTAALDPADASNTRDEAQRALTDAEQAEHEARRQAQAAQRDFDAADRAASEAQRRVHDLEHRLAQHKSQSTMNRAEPATTVTETSDGS
ncbi:MAG: hypothetical protein ACRDS1_06305 [Pseudonocardiaceae bacterium]